jgi:hypothetical protein
LDRSLVVRASFKAFVNNSKQIAFNSDHQLNSRLPQHLQPNDHAEPLEMFRAIRLLQSPVPLAELFVPGNELSPASTRRREADASQGGVKKDILTAPVNNLLGILSLDIPLRKQIRDYSTTGLTFPSIGPESLSVIPDVGKTPKHKTH